VLELNQVSIRYGDLVALDGVSLSVARGERLAVLGPSGSGKSTLLRAIAGLEQPSSGMITWDGRDLTEVPVHQRGFGLMFQDYVLFPHRDVAGNVAFGLEMHGSSPAAARARVADVLELVGLADYGPRRVTELSGGEQQRVALARALAPRPQLLMLDEPLGALDRSLRERLLSDLLELIAQLDLPAELWERPPTEFVARFLGLNNIAEADVDGHGIAVTSWGRVPVPFSTSAGKHKLLLRPEALTLDPRGRIRGTVASITYRGSRTVVVVIVEGAPRLDIELPSGTGAPAIGERIRLSVRPDGVFVLPPEGSVTLRQ